MSIFQNTIFIIFLMENHKSINSKLYGSTSESSQFTGYFTRNKSLSSNFSHTLSSNNPHYIHSQSKLKSPPEKTQPSYYFSGTKKIQHLIKNEKNLINDYKKWVEQEKKKTNKIFELSLHEIQKVLKRSQTFLEDVLDGLYQDTLKTLTEIKELAKSIYANKDKKAYKLKSMSSNKRYDKFRGKENAQLIEDILSQDREFCKQQELNKFYRLNEERLELLIEKAKRLMKMSQKSMVQGLMVSFGQVKENVRGQIEGVVSRFEEQVKVRKQENEEQNELKVVRMEEYGF